MTAATILAWVIFALLATLVAAVLVDSALRLISALPLIEGSSDA